VVVAAADVVNVAAPGELTAAAVGTPAVVGTAGGGLDVGGVEPTGSGSSTAPGPTAGRLPVAGWRRSRTPGSVSSPIPGMPTIVSARTTTYTTAKTITAATPRRTRR